MLKVLPKEDDDANLMYLFQNRGILELIGAQCSLEISSVYLIQISERHFNKASAAAYSLLSHWQVVLRCFPATPLHAAQADISCRGAACKEAASKSNPGKFAEAVVEAVSEEASTQNSCKQPRCKERTHRCCCCTLFLPEGARRISRQAACKGCQNPTPGEEYNEQNACALDGVAVGLAADEDAIADRGQVLVQHHHISRFLGRVRACAATHTISKSAYIIIIITRKRGKVCPADKLQVKAAKCLPLVGLARSKQDPINRGHGAQYLYRPPPAGA